MGCHTRFQICIETVVAYVYRPIAELEFPCSWLLVYRSIYYYNNSVRNKIYT